MASAMTAKPLLRILDAPMLAVAAECNVNGQDARFADSTDDARESGRKSGNFRVGRLMRDAFWRMKPAQ
jgi:hypothetical protein